MSRSITIEIVRDDATKIKGDVLVIKYAQARYGIDAFIYEKLIEAGYDNGKMSPEPGSYSLLLSVYGVAVNRVLFIGVRPLWEFGYTQIREFGMLTLKSLAFADAQTRHVIVTVQGVGYGLDEAESFESQIAGFIDAAKNAEIPDQLERITFVERNFGRAERLSEKY